MTAEQELKPLIEQAEASEFSHVVVFLDSQGIRWRPLPEPACQCIAEILAEYGAKVMTRQEFIDGLKAAWNTRLSPEPQQEKA